MQKPSASTASILAVAAFWLVTLAAAAQTKDSTVPAQVADYRVSGTVVSKIDGHPLDRVRVLLGDSKTRKDPRSVVTAEDGKFVFENVSAGKYTLQGLKTGFVPGAYDQHDQYSTAIVTGAGLDSENLILKLSPRAIISGRVLDESGEPARHAILTLYRNDHLQGVDEVLGAGNAQTDDLGAYEFPSLLPGTYFLAVHTQPWYAIHPASSPENSDGGAEASANVDRTLDVAYPLTYYENTTEADGATPIRINGGEHLQVEMHLNPVPALRLIFHIPMGPDHRILFPQVQQPGFDGFINVQGTPRFVSPGVVELGGIPAGRYNVRIQGQNNVTQLNGMEISKDGEEIDTSSAERLGSVKVSVAVPAEPTIPKGLSVALLQGRTFTDGFHTVSAKGETEFAQVPAGNYALRVFGGGKQYTIVSISADGVEIKGHSITVPAAASATVSVTVAAGVEVQGVVKKAGKPFAAAMVVLVPRDVAGNRDLFRRDQSDLDGTFSLRAVIAGSYTLVAIEDGWDLDWSRPEIIAAYVKRGHPIAVRTETSKAVEVKEAIEVQQKR